MRLFQEVCSSTLNLPQGTFIYNAVFVEPNPSTSRDTLNFVVASSNNTLTLLTLMGPPFRFMIHHTIENVHRSISCLQSCLLAPNGSSGQHVVTSGRDGRVKFWSLSNFDEGDVTLEFRTPNGQGISALAQSKDERLLAAGTELENDGPGDVAVYVWKIPGSPIASHEAAMQPILAFTESHTDTITYLSFHVSSAQKTRAPSGQRQPGGTTNLVTSSTDGLANVFDLSHADEDEAVVSVVNTRSAVQYLLCINDRAGGFGTSGYVCAISQDEKIAIHSLASREEAEGDPRDGLQDWDIRDTLKCDYAIDLRPSYQIPGSALVNEDKVILAVGACKSETTADPRVDIYVTSSQDFGVQAIHEPAIRLVGAHGEEVVRGVWLREECPLILSGGEDGRVRAWRSSQGAEGGNLSGSADTVESKQKKRNKHKKNQDSSARFAPY